ncbi:hypothetical protein DPMN_032938 [Dreissena polymorpha]|uniref:Uncharacterized protein n=1 Tax=Dreissena polymorpha TaxID=45954 RepID=A0A9D4M2R9_DREPO|nr:hypothetical protein DPMN_032938 [Dreissena polymorpha]
MAHINVNVQSASVVPTAKVRVSKIFAGIRMCAMSNPELKHATYNPPPDDHTGAGITRNNCSYVLLNRNLTIAAYNLLNLMIMLKYHIRVPVILVKITVFAWSIMAHMNVNVQSASVVPTAKVRVSKIFAGIRMCAMSNPELKHATYNPPPDDHTGAGITRNNCSRRQWYQLRSPELKHATYNPPPDDHTGAGITRNNCSTTSVCQSSLSKSRCLRGASWHISM